MPEPLQGAFYASVIDPDHPRRRALLAGPFLTFAEARAIRAEVVRAACDVDPKAWWYAYGVARVWRFSLRPVGVLNAALGLPTVIADRWR